MQYYRILNWCISFNERRFEFKSSLHQTQSNLLQLNHEPLVQVLALTARNYRGIESLVYLNMERHLKPLLRFHFLLPIEVSPFCANEQPSTAVAFGAPSKFCTNNNRTIRLLSARWCLNHSRWHRYSERILRYSSLNVHILWQGQDPDARTVGGANRQKKFTVSEDFSVTHCLSSPKSFYMI